MAPQLSSLFVLLAVAVVGLAQEYNADGPVYNQPTSFNFNDLPVVEAPKPPFHDLPAVANNESPQQSPGGQQFQLVTKVFQLPNGAITTLQVPQYNNYS